MPTLPTFSTFATTQKDWVVAATFYNKIGNNYLGHSIAEASIRNTVKDSGPLLEKLGGVFHDAYKVAKMKNTITPGQTLDAMEKIMEIYKFNADYEVDENGEMGFSDLVIDYIKFLVSFLAYDFGKVISMFNLRNNEMEVYGRISLFHLESRTLFSFNLTESFLFTKYTDMGGKKVDYFTNDRIAPCTQFPPGKDTIAWAVDSLDEFINMNHFTIISDCEYFSHTYHNHQSDAPCNNPDDTLVMFSFIAKK